MTLSPDTMGLDGTDLREGYAEVGDIKLHYMEGGDGQLVVLLHGFPEFWYGWRLQIPALGSGRVPCRRTRHAGLQPVVAPQERERLRHQTASQ